MLNKRLWAIKEKLNTLSTDTSAVLGFIFLSEFAVSVDLWLKILTLL